MGLEYNKNLILWKKIENKKEMKIKETIEP
jgi:hypothetical protein